MEQSKKSKSMSTHARIVGAWSQAMLRRDKLITGQCAATGFCVRDGTVKEKKKHEYTCPHCGGLVASNVTNSVRQPVLRHRWKGERPKEERAEDGRQEIAQRGRCGPREKGKWCATAQQGQFRPLEKKELVRQSPEPTVCATSPTVSHRAQSPQSSKCEVLERLKRPESRSMAEPLAICRGV